MKVGDCLHYNGMQNPCCDASVNYEQVGGTAPGLFLRMPCRPSFRLDVPKLVCEKRAPATEADVAESERIRLESLDRMRAIATALLPLRKTTTQGAFPCPACKSGTVRYAIARSNGHAAVKCSTPGCAEWME